MAGPWEKYAAPESAEAGPWAKYQTTAEKPKESSLASDIAQGVGNLAAGAVRGAGSIGATILYPYDKLTDVIKGDRKQTLSGLVTGAPKPLSRNEERRQQIDEGLRTLGAEPESMLYQGGKLAGEIAGTAGVGGALANGVRAVAPGAVGLTNALATSGMRAGSTPGAVNMLTRMAGGALAGGASAGLVNPEDALTGAAIGGALPPVLGLAGKAGTKIGAALRGGEMAPEVRGLAKRASELGIDVPADRLANSKPMNALASSLNYVPFSGRTATETKMQDQLNRALSRTFGQDSDNVTGALRTARGDLGKKFDQVLSANKVKVDSQFLSDLANAEQAAIRELGESDAGIIKRQIDEIISKGATGEIDGQAAYNIKKTLDNIGKRNSAEAYYASDLRRNLMDALNRSLTPQQAADFATTRKQYGNMLSLEKLAQNGAEGDISIARLANMKNINNKDLQELADISAQFLKSRESAHGAMQRVTVGTGLGVGTGAMFGLPALAGGALAGRGANMLLNSGVARNALMGETSPLITNSLNKLVQVGYRTAPVVSGQ